MSREVTLTLPAERPVNIGFIADELPGLLTVNAALHGLNGEARAVFRWQLSVLIEAAEAGLVDQRLPGPQEQAVLRDVELGLHQGLAAEGNALFAARLVHDGRSEVIWRVHQPQAAQTLLQTLIDQGDAPREFSVRLDDDPRWARLAEYLAQAV